ncbi:MAG: radical SAM protein [Vicinamibacterales bacterium]
MRASLFNVSVPLAGGTDVFLLNTLSDAQAIVSRDVADFLSRLGHTDVDPSAATREEREALSVLRADGFVVDGQEEERAAVRKRFADMREDISQLRVTVLTTLQCNFACDYCVQGDHGPHSNTDRMSLDTAGRTLAWIESRLDELQPTSFALTFFGGEPLLNLPAVYYLAEHAWQACERRGIRMLINVITNGLLLTPEVVDRLLPFGLNGVKVTLDGARDEHNAARPLRGGQGTFDRIVENVRHVAGKCRVAIGGNFQEGTTGSFVELLDFLAAQDFAPLLDKVAFKPVIQPKPKAPRGVIPLTLVTGSTPVTSALATRPQPASSPCDSCHFVDDQMIALREATQARGFRTVDGVHMGPCELHRRHAYTIGPNGGLYTCPGFAGEASEAVGHITTEATDHQRLAAARFERLSPWRSSCGDCAYVPVCGGGCSVASHTEQGDLFEPSCHKSSFDAGVAALAREAAQNAEVQPSLSSPFPPFGKAS